MLGEICRRHSALPNYLKFRREDWRSRIEKELYHRFGINDGEVSGEDERVTLAMPGDVSARMAHQDERYKEE